MSTRAPMPGWHVVPLEEIPSVADTEPGVTWYPLEHAFGLTAFGANAFVAGDGGESLICAHDEGESGQEELYLILRGTVRFTIDDERVDARAISVAAIRDPSLKRSAVAVDPGTTLIALGGTPRPEFQSTWRREHFEGIERLI